MEKKLDVTSVELLQEALGKLGYSSKNIVLGGSKYTQFIASNGNVWLTSNTQISYPFISSTVTRISTQKDLAYDLATTLGVSIPLTALISKDDPKQQALERMLTHTPLITKPNDSSLSRGLTLNITTMEQLRSGLDFAFEFSDKALIQTQATGEEIRFTVLHGKVMAALLRQTPRVKGDGTRSVAELLALENTRRHQIDLPYITYPQLDKDLIKVNLELARIPAKDEIIELSRSTMIRGGASVYNVIDMVHESYIETVQNLAAALGKGFVVVDMLVDNYQEALAPHNYTFIEFNKAPVLKLFYSCRDGKNFDVLSHLVPMIDHAIAGVNHES